MYVLKIKTNINTNLKSTHFLPKLVEISILTSHSLPPPTSASSALEPIYKIIMFSITLFLKQKSII